MTTENTPGTSYADRVAKGAALLDRMIGPGWPARVGQSFATRTGWDCVSVRATNALDWKASMLVLGLTLPEYTAHGFRVSDEEYVAAGPLDPYDTLDELWSEEIARRLSVPPDQNPSAPA